MNRRTSVVQKRKTQEKRERTRTWQYIRLVKQNIYNHAQVYYSHFIYAYSKSPSRHTKTEMTGGAIVSERKKVKKKEKRGEAGDVSPPFLMLDN